MILRKRLNPAGKKNKFGKAWMHEHVSDHWVKEAQAKGYRSRAAFKLLQIAERDKLLRAGMSVVDLGAAPGSWCQVLHERLGPSATIVALDLLPMAPIVGVQFVQGDFCDTSGLDALSQRLKGKVDLVLSDLAPNLSGVAATDQAGSVGLGELALEFATQWLRIGGDAVIKAFQGAGFTQLHRGMQVHFDRVYVRKPKASRERSREVYLVGKSFHENVAR